MPRMTRGNLSTDADALLSLDGVGKDFGHFTAVREVSILVRRGERKAIIGPNGAGKTTLFNMLSGELKPSRGRILYRGKDITQLPMHALAHIGIGRSFQITNIFRGLSVLENIRIAVQSRQGFQYDFLSRARRLAATAETADEILGTIGLSPYRTAPASGLSHGDQRRLEIGIVLATESRAGPPGRADRGHVARGSPRDDGVDPQRLDDAHSALR